MISLSVILLGLGLIAGLATGGKISNIASARFKMGWLVFAGLGVQIAGEIAAAFIPNLRDAGRGLMILGVSYGLIITFLIINRTKPGAALIGAGLFLNLLVIVPNGGMPVSARAVRIAGIGSVNFLGKTIKHRLMTPETFLWFLGDIIPVPVVRKVVSIGDIVIASGIFVLVKRLVQYEPKRLLASGEQPPASMP